MKPNKISEVKQKLENFRSDQHLLTAEMLTELNDIESRNLKQLFNYNLTGMRENEEIKNDVAQEYDYYKINVDSYMKVLRRQQEEKLSLKGLRKKEYKKMLAQIYSTVGQRP